MFIARLPLFCLLGLLTATTAALWKAFWKSSPTGVWSSLIGSWIGPYENWPWEDCLTKDDAEDLVKAFVDTTSGPGPFNRTIAEAAIYETFSDSSNSLASVINQGGTEPVPLLDPSYTNKTSFIEANAVGPANKFEVLNIYRTCRVIIYRFEVPSLKPQMPRGIAILETEPAPRGNLFKFQISRVYNELNSVAWLVSENVIKPKVEA